MSSVKELSIFELYERELLAGSAEEMTNVIYDTLFKNTDYPQFDTCVVDDQECNAVENQIEYVYMGNKYKISIELVK